VARFAVELVTAVVGVVLLAAGEVASVAVPDDDDAGSGDALSVSHNQHNKSCKRLVNVV